MELSNCQSLRDRLDGYQPRVLEQERLANTLRDRVNTVQNNALDVSRYLSILAAESTPVQLGLSAPELAQKVLTLQHSMGVGRPQGLLEVIARGPVLAIDTGDMM